MLGITISQPSFLTSWSLYSSKEIENKLVKKGTKGANLGVWREQAGDNTGNPEGVVCVCVCVPLDREGFSGGVTFELRREM